MNELIVLVLVISVCVVFVGSFIATLFIPNYGGAVVFAPVMTAAIGLVAGVGISKARHDSGGNRG